MHNLRQFETELRDLIGDPSTLRPFICDGSPLECKIFIVGANAATETSGFWNYWDADYGFHKARWFEHYKMQRANAPLREGKTRRQTVSSTRRVLNWIAEGAAPTMILETNIYSVATAQLSDLPLENRMTAVIQYLLAEIQPKLIVAHGKDAERYFEQEHKELKVMSLAHLSRGWSKVKALELGREIERIAQES